MSIAVEDEVRDLDVDMRDDPRFSALTGRILDGLRASAPARSGDRHLVPHVLIEAPDLPTVVVLDAADGDHNENVADTEFWLGWQRSGDAVTLVAGCHADRLDRSIAERMVEHVATVLAATHESDPAVGDLDVVTRAERASMAEWNSTAVGFDGGETLPSLLPGLGTYGPAESPAVDLVAVELADRRVSRREFADLVGRVTPALIDLGIGPGSCVGVMGERSLGLLVAVHAVASAGAAYLPLEPDLPPGRVAHMLADSGATVVLGEAGLLPQLADQPVEVVDLHSLLNGPVLGDSDKGSIGTVVGVGPTPDDVAYVIFTSGSTGRPKGVANTHRGIVNRLRWMQDRFPLGPDDAVLWKTPFGFDVSVWELFWPLSVGARLVVAEPGGHRDPGYLVRTIIDRGVTTVHFVPSMLRLFLDHPEAGLCLGLRRVVCSGEALSRDLVDRFFTVLPGVELHNLYGPTEAAIDVSAWRCEPGGVGPVPIGAPVANTTIHVLDTRMRQVPIGVVGELHIGGIQVAQGYVGRDDLTAERFVPDPFRPGGRLYRTGDLARWSASGQVEFLGRGDSQVKVRGQRVELGEIEAVLVEHPVVAEAAVTAIEHGGETNLVAHITASAPVDEPELRTALAQRLPEPMIPGRIMVHDALPLTANGKLDRRALGEMSSALREPGLTTGEPRPAPLASDGANDLERFLIEVWCEVLDRTLVGRHDRVADLGASSLHAASFVNTVQRKLDEFIYVVSVFLAPTVAEYAEFLAHDYPDAVARHFDTAAAPQGAAAVAPRVDDAMVAAMVNAVPTFGPFLSWQAEPPNPPAVFILSPPRSGTTLLRVMLAGHPRIFAAPELQLLGFDTLAHRRAALDGRFSPWREGTIRAVMELERCDADVAAAFMDEHERSGTTAKELFRRLQDLAGNRLVVDKSPSYALDPGALRNAEQGFSAAKYIHLVRDPLAMSRSFESYHMDQIMFLRDHPWSGRILGELVWTLSHRNILEFADQVPNERLLRVRFEDLVGDPESVMTTVASFLDLDFDPILVRPYDDLGTKMVDGLHAESTPMGDTRLLERDRIDPRVVERWERHGEESPLGQPALDLAHRFGYVPAASTPATTPSAGSGTRRQYAESMRRRRKGSNP